MYKRNWKLFAEDILESVELIEKYTLNMTEQNFINDRKTVDAVVRNLEIIGEAAKNIPDEVKNTCNDIDWKGIIGLRNRITHEYFGISLQIIWNIIKQEIPRFKKEITQILNNPSV